MVVKPKEIPHYIDSTVEHVGVSHIRYLNATNLGKLKHMIVVRNGDKSLAVIICYEQYMAMQSQLELALQTIQACRDH